MPELRWLDGYSGETIDELLALEGECRIDSIILAIHQAFDQKNAREGEDALSVEERIVVAIEALQAEVNNGGFQQFFVNSSKEFAPIMVAALTRVGCPQRAEITQRAIDALHLSGVSVEAIDAAMTDVEDEEELDKCDELYFASSEDTDAQLFAFIKANKNSIKF